MEAATPHIPGTMAHNANISVNGTAWNRTGGKVGGAYNITISKDEYYLLPGLNMTKNFTYHSGTRETMLTQHSAPGSLPCSVTAMRRFRCKASIRRFPEIHHKGPG